MEKKYPIGAEHYTLYEEVGQGVSASVHRALCVPLDEIVAIKVLDFERDRADLNNISRETQTMVLVDHPNVLKSHCSFVSDHNLWVVMPYMAGGSCFHILKAAHPDGFEEVVIATVLREILKGLEYLHHHGHIHRDVKAGNILIGARGAIKLGDFGVSACLFYSGDRQRTRKTFVGTPCWMAPEVMEQLNGYDFKADIWSFGITALELAHGHAPFSKYPPMKVLLMTLQNAPPGLDEKRDRKFSKSFKQMTASCLVKDPSKRPSAKKLLKHSFFKQARSNDYIARKLLEGLPDLGDRLKALKIKEEDMLAQKKIPDGLKEEMSQNEYKRGISDWNFNLEDVKAEASLIQDEDTTPERDQEGSSYAASGIDQENNFQHQLSSTCHHSQVSDIEDNECMQNQSSLPFTDSTVTNTITKYEKSDDDANILGTIHEKQIPQNSFPQEDNIQSSLAGKHVLDACGGLFDGLGRQAHQRRGCASGSINFPDAYFLSNKYESDKLQNELKNISSNGALTPQAVDDASPEILSKTCSTSATSDDLDEKAKPVIQQKGRFKVMSENVDLEKVAPSPLLQKSHSMQEQSKDKEKGASIEMEKESPNSTQGVIFEKSEDEELVPSSRVKLNHPPSQVLGKINAPMQTRRQMHQEVITQHSATPLTPPSDATLPNVVDPSLYSMLLSCLKTNIMERENILSLMKRMAASDCIVNGGGTPMNITSIEKSLLEAAHDKEKELIFEITDLQLRLTRAQEELQKYKTENTQP